MNWRRFAAEDGISVSRSDRALDEVGVDFRFCIFVMGRRDDAINKVWGDLTIEGGLKSFLEIPRAI